MKILINASNLKKGGGLQVADSICSFLDNYLQHQFVVVLSDSLEETRKRIKEYANVKVIGYNLPKTIKVILTGRDRFLDKLVEEENVTAVLTVFGPSLWIPKILHISGFARAHCVLLDSPFFKRMSMGSKIRSYLERKVLMWSFRRCANIYFTENKFISERLQKLFKKKRVYTVTNYYNQVFDDVKLWTKNILLPDFDGVSLLMISANYPHKNFSIIEPTISYLHGKYPDFKFRFVLTISKEQLKVVDTNAEKDIIFLGKVSLTECPNLYTQCDIVFSSTLLECFSAVYPEAMRMKRPIITTDLNFSRSLCEDAALYYDALSPIAFGEAIYKLSNDQRLRTSLIEAGSLQLKKYDNYEERSRKLIEILENEYSKQI